MVGRGQQRGTSCKPDGRGIPLLNFEVFLLFCRACCITCPGDACMVRLSWDILKSLGWMGAANALTGPRQVSGEPGGAVTIQCHYTPSSINRHQRKYWCRLRPLTWICHTIVSSNKHIHHRYHGRVALTDFPQRGLFVVRLSQLSLDDVGRYRCGIGDNNYMLSFSMNLTISAGPFNHSTTPVARELITGSFATASPATNTWTPGTTQMTDGQGMEWGEVASTLGTSKTTASTQGGQTPEVTRSIATGPGTWIEGPIRATVPIPEHPASKTGIMSNMTEGVWPLETSGVKTASAEGRTEGDLGTAAAGSDPRATPSQNPATGPRRPLDKESSVKSASPEEENMTRVLPPVFTVLVLFVLVALALLQRKLQRKRTPHEIRRVTLLRMTCFLDPDRQPGQLPQVAFGQVIQSFSAGADVLEQRAGQMLGGECCFYKGGNGLCGDPMCMIQGH
ncbi:High affinity immunoglobulin alpha and immunoglobulin mu Fc receptor [Tupaia chinensis]|nr:High affinity immunoglobulin alpha and immunoglobulin mu Fc receptor [Tupaia chinensis]